MKRAVLDIETDGVVDVKAIWVVVLRDLDNEDHTEVFRLVHEQEEEHERLRQRLAGCMLLVGHNLLGFDLPWLARYGIHYRGETLDTLVVSRLLNYNQPGGHSLEAWGNKFQHPKSLFSDYSRWSQELEDRCILDTLLTSRLYRYFKIYLDDNRWAKSIALEHRSAKRCLLVSSNGFTFDINQSMILEKELNLKVESLRLSLQTAFPPRSVFLREITPSTTKSGALHAKDFKWLGEDRDLSRFDAGASFSLFVYEPFNPNSPSQVVERLNEAGWRPTEKTKGHLAAERENDEEALRRYRVIGWRVCEENLETLPEDAPEAARKLAEYLLLSNRLSTLRQWQSVYKASTGRVHGVFNHIGSWTHRKSHQNPNMANVPALVNRKGKPQPYGPEFRSLFQAARGKVLVGTDADGIQLRIFAHLCNDRKLIEALINGKKEDKTDIHSLNKAILDTICNSREAAKTYIYALLLGAGFPKQAEILNCSIPEAQAGLKRILDFYPGWKELKEVRLKKEGEQGFIHGLDGRKIILPAPRLALAGHLQSGESIVMKMANELWDDVLTRMRIPNTQVNDVHDEWQTETEPQYADVVGRVQSDSIRVVGEMLKLNCPLAGSVKFGHNWKDTH